MFNHSDTDMDLAIAQINAMKTHKGKNIFLIPGKTDPNVQRLELSVPSLNYILSSKYGGPGSGFPMGKIFNFWGPESIGKTASAGQICGDFYQAGANVHWIDKEHSFDGEYFYDAFGLDINDNKHFSVSQPDNAEEAFDIIVSMVDNKAADIIVLDSIPALGTVASNDKEASENSMATLSRKLAEHFPRIINKIGKAKISIIYINQVRSAMGAGIAYDKYTGGNPMRFYPHVALKFKRKGFLTKGTGEDAEFIGTEVNISGDKNKTAPPKKWATLDLIPGVGFCPIRDKLKLALSVGTAKQSGAWFTIGEERFQGYENTIAALNDSPSLVDSLWQATLKELHPQVDKTTGEIITEETPQAEQAEVVSIETDTDQAETSKKSRKKAA